MNYRPILDCILVSQKPPETKTSAGFFIPESVAEKPNIGRVLSIGPGRPNKTGTVIPVAGINVGDDIMFPKGAGIIVKGGDGEQLLVLKEEEIIAVVE